MIRLPPLAALALLAGCNSGAIDTDPPPEPIATVRTTNATASSAADSQSIYGIVEAGAGSMISIVAQSEAVVDSVAVPTGTAVQAGQLVATLRPSPTTQLDLAKATSDAAAAGSALARAIRLRGDGLASDADVETARATTTSARATRDALAGQSARLVLRAPVAGTVGALSIRAGDLLAAGTLVATIMRAGDVRARFGADPGIARRLHAGQPIRIKTTDATSPAIEAVIVGIDPQPDTTTRLATVFAKLPQSARLGIGGAVQAEIMVGAPLTGLSIPYAALLDDGGKPYVFTVDKGIAHRVDVTPGSTSGDRIMIRSGLMPGARVVTEGGTALEDGMRVREQGAR